MRVPPFARYHNFLSGVGLFLSGAIIGSALFMSIYQHHFDLVVKQMRELKTDKENLLLNIDSLNKYKNKQGLINSVTVNVQNNDTNPLPTDVQKEIEKRVRSELKIVIGQKTSSVKDAPELYEKLISQKTYYGIHEQDYIIQVKFMVLVQSELTVWVTAKEFRKN